MSLGSMIAHKFDEGDLRQAFALAFVPESWRREACIERGIHAVTFMYSGDWYCYECGTYDEPGESCPKSERQNPNIRSAGE